MEERKDATTSTDSKTESTGTPERDAEATSSETLSDVEGNEKVSTGGSGSGSGGALEGSSPKPVTEGGGGRADGSDTGGPM
jgi:hypothetical protein